MPEAITDIPLGLFPSLAAEFGLRAFAADQLIEWLYRTRVASFDEMTNISKAVRSALKERFVMDALEIAGTQEASDGTRKFLCRAKDGRAVECVYMPTGAGRTTVCVSTQVGCAMGCSFCRTAGMGFVRDLTQGEILGQLTLMMRAHPDPVTNVVLMGMGEPLANLDAVSSAVEVMLDGRAFGFSKRRLTLSTAGLLPQLEKFAEKFDIKIAISLNATTDEARSQLMPINRRYPIAEIMESCRKYSERSRHRITFEYVLIGGLNDTDGDAARLVELLKGISAKVNLIPFNPFEGSGLKAPEEGTSERWSDFLRSRGVQANVRISRGQEILAACGQLATSFGA
ncbi:MAG: 23S rRNA (adenine(2503)-C(2))-methyltransferase RlmN [Pseudomonadota bacterium]